MTRAALVLWLCCGPVAAVADDGTAARAAFAEGERAFREDDYGLALEHFRKAMELAPHDAVRFNVGVCLERLGRFREAYLEYELAAKSTQLDASSRARAKEQASRVRERLGRLLVEEPAGAEVLLDGHPAGRAPCELLVDPMPHELVLRAASRSVKTTIDLARGETRRLQLGFPAEVSLTPPPVTAPGRKAGVGPLTWVGGALTIAGFACFTGFGLRATALHGEYLAAPTVPTREQGVLMRDLANVSLVVGIVGVVAAVVDLAWLAQRPAR